MLFFALLLAMRLTPEAPNVPLKQPQIAVSGKTVALAYGAGNVVYFARSEDGGKTFSKPIKVGEESRLALGRHRGPRIVFAGTSLVITAETHEAAGKGGDLLAWSSADGGKHWTSPVRVNDVPTSAREGLHGTAAAVDGTVWVVWLDLRQKGMRLYGSLSKDAGKTWSANQLVYSSQDGHICECCHPTAFIGPRGELYAMWRNWLSGSRDMYYAVSTDRKTWTASQAGRRHLAAERLSDGRRRSGLRWKWPDYTRRGVVRALFTPRPQAEKKSHLAKERTQQSLAARMVSTWHGQTAPR